jgi:taurine dioxygenase
MSSLPFTVTALSPAGAGEITGLDCSHPLDPATMEALKQAFRDHPVLAIRDQDLDAVQQGVFSRQWGALEPQDQLHYTCPEDQDVLILSNEMRPDGTAIGVVDAGDFWHSDSSHKTEPCRATILYSIKNPSRGGDTEFCNMYQVYDSLSDDLRRRIDGLNAVHHVSKLRNKRVVVSPDRPGAAEYYAKRAQEVPEVVQPIVRTHPETGRQALYISPRFTIAIDGMDDADGQLLLDALFKAMLDKRFHYRHKWHDGDLVMWDNRCLNHRACGGYALSDIRRMHRTTIVGDKPFYRPAA